MMKPIDLERAYRIFNIGATTLVSADMKATKT